MERLLEVLPEEFIRCHRGFIVNQSHVCKFMTAKKYLELDTGEILPVSRSCQAQWKRAEKEKK